MGEDENELTKCSRWVQEKAVVFVQDKLALKEAGASESECDAELAVHQTTQSCQLLNLELSLIGTVALLALPSADSHFQLIANHRARQTPSRPMNAHSFL